ncbi:hypothetical protein [Floridanema evergladense]|uniref:Uncharacterized protein n=1 Tax=Floridaenema evergladense BLCC-F167 TaxID=3153639 RepID=A0ABV4WKN8_9CYAN
MNTNGSVANGNGRKKTNSDAKTLLETPVTLELKNPPKTPEQKAEELKEVAKHFIGSDSEPTEQPEQITSEEPEEELDAEELLRQSKRAETASQTAPTPEEEPEETEELAITKASDAIANKTQEQVAKLVKASAQKSKANRLTGMQMAQKDLKEIKEGYNLQMIAGLTALNEDTAIDLSEQLNLLSGFTDEQTGEQTNKELQELLASDDPKSLEEFSKKLTQTLGKKGKRSTSGLNLLPEN